MAKITPKQYAQTLFEMTQEKNETDVSKIVVKFVEELRKNGHVNLHKQIIAIFEKIYNTQNGIVKARVSTATDLVQTQKERIEKKIMELYHAQKADVEYERDEKIIGGIVIRVNDEIMDGSVRKKIRLLAQKIT